MDYEVIVGNVGSVYAGKSVKAARVKFRNYVEASKAGVGRAGNEPVTLLANGEPVTEYEPPDGAGPE